MPTLSWVGKDKVVNHHHDVPFRLLDKQYTFTANEGTPANSTANRIIYGDNLEALKSLLPEFEGKVNCILESGKRYVGKINAIVPQDAKSWYDAAVVCYGIGFSKERLAKKGVRPVLYFGSELVSNVKKLRDSLDKFHEGQYRDLVSEMVHSIIPLMNSLMENEDKQGFTWEREWRYPDPNGFSFEFGDIEIICCPEEEQEQIAQQLGDFAGGIKFVRSWSQYDDIKNFLGSRESGWKKQVLPKSKSVDELKKLELEYKQEFHKINAYKTYASKLLEEIKLIDGCITDLQARIDEVHEELSSIDAVDLFCSHCGCLINEEVGAVAWNEDENEYLCGDCYCEFMRKCTEE